MNTRVRIEYLHGNTPVEVCVGGRVAGTMEGEKRSIEVDLHSGQAIAVYESGEPNGSVKRDGMQANATVDPNNTDDDTRRTGGYRSPDLPPGAGDNGSNVKDVRLDGDDTAPKASEVDSVGRVPNEPGRNT